MISDHGAQDARNWSGSLPLNTKGWFLSASAGSSWQLLVLEEYLQMASNILHVLIVNWHVDEGSTWVEKLPNHLSFLSSSIDVHMQHNLSGFVHLKIPELWKMKAFLVFQENTNR